MDFAHCHESFAVQNIVCKIFQFLDLKSLLTCDLVSKQWFNDAKQPSSIYHLNTSNLFNTSAGSTYGPVLYHYPPNLHRFKMVASISIRYEYYNNIVNFYQDNLGILSKVRRMKIEIDVSDADQTRRNLWQNIIHNLLSRNMNHLVSIRIKTRHNIMGQSVQPWIWSILCENNKNADSSPNNDINGSDANNKDGKDKNTSDSDAKGSEKIDTNDIQQESKDDGESVTPVLKFPQLREIVIKDCNLYCFPKILNAKGLRTLKILGNSYLAKGFWNDLIKYEKNLSNIEEICFDNSFIARNASLGQFLQKSIFPTFCARITQKNLKKFQCIKTSNLYVGMGESIGGNNNHNNTSPLTLMNLCIWQLFAPYLLTINPPDGVCKPVSIETVDLNELDHDRSDDTRFDCEAVLLNTAVSSNMFNVARLNFIPLNMSKSWRLSSLESFMIDIAVPNHQPYAIPPIMGHFIRSMKCSINTNAPVTDYSHVGNVICVRMAGDGSSSGVTGGIDSEDVVTDRNQGADRDKENYKDKEMVTETGASLAAADELMKVVEKAESMAKTMQWKLEQIKIKREKEKEKKDKELEKKMKEKENDNENGKVIANELEKSENKINFSSMFTFDGGEVVELPKEQQNQIAQCKFAFGDELQEKQLQEHDKDRSDSNQKPKFSFSFSSNNDNSEKIEKDKGKDKDKEKELETQEKEKEIKQKANDSENEKLIINEKNEDKMNFSSLFTFNGAEVVELPIEQQNQVQECSFVFGDPLQTKQEPANDTTQNQQPTFSFSFDSNSNNKKEKEKEKKGTFDGFVLDFGGNDDNENRLDTDTVVFNFDHDKPKANTTEMKDDSKKFTFNGTNHNSKNNSQNTVNRIKTKKFIFSSNNDNTAPRQIVNVSKLEVLSLHGGNKIDLNYIAQLLSQMKFHNSCLTYLKIDGLKTLTERYGKHVSSLYTVGLHLLSIRTFLADHGHPCFQLSLKWKIHDVQVDACSDQTVFWLSKFYSHFGDISKMIKESRRHLASQTDIPSMFRLVLLIHMKEQDSGWNSVNDYFSFDSDWIKKLIQGIRHINVKSSDDLEEEQQEKKKKKTNKDNENDNVKRSATDNNVIGDVVVLNSQVKRVMLNHGFVDIGLCRKKRAIVAARNVFGNKVAPKSKYKHELRVDFNVTV